MLRAEDSNSPRTMLPAETWKLLEGVDAAGRGAGLVFFALIPKSVLIM